MINIGNITIKNLYISNIEVKEAWLGNIKVYPNESSEFKFRLTYSDGSVVEKECETNDTITRDEIDNFENITNVVIGDCVSRIGVGAFYNCSGLTSVDIPSGVTNIGESAFEGCSGLTSVTAESTTPPTLSDKAFDNTNDCPIYVPNASVDAYKTDWSDYTSRIEPMNQEYQGFCRLTLDDDSVVEIQGSGELTKTMITEYKLRAVKAEVGTLCTSIGSQAFQDCQRLTSVTIGDSVTNISSGAFNGCLALTSIDIPSNVTTISDYAFSSTGLKSINIPSSVTSISGHAFENCSSLTSVTIPNSVTSIGGYAFNYCIGLISVNIPSSVTSISSYNTFANCTNLIKVTVNATTPPTLRSDTTVFENTNDCPIYVTSQSVNAYKMASGWNNYANRIQAIS